MLNLIHAATVRYHRLFVDLIAAGGLLAFRRQNTR